MRAGNVNMSQKHGQRQGEVLKYVCSPENYGIVEPGVYRSNALFAINFPFVKQLALKTVVYLSPEAPIRAVTQFLEETGTRFIHLGLKGAWKTYATWKPISEELIKDALEIVLDVDAHPVMVMCASGIHQTGTLVGCLRRLQKWNLTAVVEEYRRFAGTKARYVNEQFMELFDEDLVTLPKNLPSWFIEQRRMMEEEENEYKTRFLSGLPDRRPSVANVAGVAPLEDGAAPSLPETNCSIDRVATPPMGGSLDYTSVDMDKENGAEVSAEPSYRKYYYSISSPLTTENRSYKRKIIGKMDS